VAPRVRGATDPAERELLSAGDVARTIARMAHQIIEKTSLGSEGHRPVVLLGIPSRGAPLARRLAELIAEFSDAAVPVGTLDITLYRDDLSEIGPKPLVRPTAVDFDLAGLPIKYSGEPLLPSPELVHWVERRTREAIANTRATPVSATP